MAGILGKIFGGKKKDAETDTLEGYVEDTVYTIIEKAGLDLSCEVEGTEDGGVFVEFFGEDEGLMKNRDGQLLDAFQLFLTRSMQHQNPDDRVNISVDCGGFREEARQSLLELADRLKDIALSKGKPVYFRALPPRDRKVIHQYLAEDGQVKSWSVGDGLYKKIKIYPAKGQSTQDTTAENFGNR